MSYPVYYVPAGDVLPILFGSYGKTNGESITLTGLAVTDIEIYKDGGVTQRASDAGYTLLDTDGIDFDGITGIHGFSIDTGDNTDAGFYTVGAWFHVVVSAVTVDSQTVSFVAAAFRIMPAESIAGKPKVDVDAWLGTAAATPSVAGVPEVDLTHIAGATTNVAALATNVDAILADTGTDGVVVAAASKSGYSLTATTGLGNQTANITGNLSGSVGSVTGAVGSVTGNVGGNVAGSVGSVTAGVTLAASAVQAIWDATTSALTTIGSIGASLVTVASNVATLISRLTASRAGYLDNLNIGGNVASSAEVTAIQNNTRVVRVVPSVIERPDAAPDTYRVELLLYDDNGNMEAPDSAPTIALVNQGGTDRSSRLDSTTMALIETGRYRAIYTADPGDALEQLVWTFSVVEGGATRKYGNQSVVVDTTAVDFTSADRTKLEALETRLTATRAGYLDNLSAGAVATASALSTAAGNVATILGKFTGITALAQWLGAMAGKQTPDSTALAEMRATGAGSGTFDPATDSPEALAELIAALENLSAAEANAEVVDAIATDARGEPGQGAPPASASLALKIDYLYKAWRNKKTQTASEHRLFADNESTVDQKAAVSSDGTTTTVGEMATGA